jgi:REP element-mobilizing transposase RayT
MTMGRPLRIEYEGAFYHITSRGNEKRTIFQNDQDYFQFIQLLERIHKRYEVLIHTYVLMFNHYHLLLETPSSNLIATMHDLNAAYTNYFNRRHKRVGHLFQGRYHSLLVDRDAYLLELSRYIHLNPVRARIVDRPEEYRWSSYLNFISSVAKPKWLCISEVLGQLHGYLGRARNKYRYYIEEGLKGTIKNPIKEVQSGLVLGADSFLEQVKEQSQDIKKDTEIPVLRELRRRTNIEPILEKVAAFYNIPLEKLFQKRRPPHPGSQVALYLVRKKTDLSLNEIGNYFGGRHYTAVSAAYRRVEKRRERDEEFDQALKGIEKET